MCHARVIDGCSGPAQAVLAAVAPLAIGLIAWAAMDWARIALLKMLVRIKALIERGVRL